MQPNMFKFDIVVEYHVTNKFQSVFLHNLYFFPQYQDFTGTSPLKWFCPSDTII